MHEFSFECAICGKEQQSFARAKFPDGRAALSCRHCDTSFVYPLPSREEIAAYYANYPPTVETSSAHSELLVSRHGPILKYLVRQFAPQTRLKVLDFGFGAGAFLKLVARNGHRAYGADLSDQNCVQLKAYSRRAGLAIATVNLNQHSLDVLDCKEFDVITLFQAIEHLSDPVRVLRDLTGRLAPGGIVYVECPNENAWYLLGKNLLRKRMGRENFFGSLNPPQHLFGFSRTSLELVMARVDCRILECSDYAFCDGIHQTETLDWYPSLGQFCMQKSRWNLYGLAKLVIRMMDPFMSKMFGVGGGLYALARRGSPQPMSASSENAMKPR